MRFNRVLWHKKVSYTPTKRLSDVDLVAELNVEKFELAKAGYIKFSHGEKEKEKTYTSCSDSSA